MTACTPSIHVFLGHPLFLSSHGIQSIINYGMLETIEDQILGQHKLLVAKIKIIFIKNIFHGDNLSRYKPAYMNTLY